MDGRPLALSHFTLTSARTAEIYSCYRHPHGWGSGIAGALMTETLRRIRDDGGQRVRLWTSRDTPRSRRFFIKCGLTETGAVRTYDFGDGNPLTQVEYPRDR